MNKVIVLAGVLAGVSSAATAQTATAEADVALGKINNQYICTFDRSVPGSAVRNEAAKAAGPMMGDILHVYQHAIKGFAVRLPAQPGGRSAVAELRANNPKITGCEQDQIVKAFQRGKPGSGGGGGQRTPAGITRVGGAATGPSSNTAWVIDSGIDLDHPDLQVDTSRSRSFVGGDADDKNGHGTHVAGTIAARNNTIGVVGVSPGSEVVAVRVLGASGSGSTSGVIAGVDYVAERAANGDVANMSLGGGYSKALNDAVIAAADQTQSGERGVRIHFTLAAGNESEDASTHSPASANGAYVYTVSAVDSADRLASFSNFGLGVDYAEPGVSVLSTYKGGGYATASGTSMAAPHLAGILLVTKTVVNGGAIKNDKDSQAEQIGCWTTCPAN